MANSIGEFITNFGTEAAHIPAVGSQFPEAEVPGARGIFSGYGGYILSAGEHELELLVSQWPGGSNYPYQIVHYRVGI